VATQRWALLLIVICVSGVFAQDADSGDISAEESELEAESGALKNEVDDISSQEAAESEKSGNEDAPTDEAGRKEASFTKLVKCQKKLDFEIEQERKHDEAATSCKSTLAQAELDTVTQERLAQKAENLRHKAKLEEEDALRLMQKALNLHKKETDLGELEEKTCNARKKQMQSAHLHTLEALKRTAELHDAEVKGATATATSKATDEKLKILAENEEEVKGIREKIQTASDDSVKVAQEEAAHEVESIEAASVREIEKVKHESALEVERTLLEQTAAVNKTKLEADEAVKAAENGRDQALKERALAETKLVEAKKVLKATRAARAEAITRRISFKAWTDHKLSDALAAVKRATDGSKMLAMLVSQTASTAKATVTTVDTADAAGGDETSDNDGNEADGDAPTGL